MKTLVIPLFIPHLGCPHACVFCNQKKIAGNYERPTKDTVYRVVNEFIQTLDDIHKYYIELAFYGGSFTGVEKGLQEELLAAAHEFKRKGIIGGIRLSTRPDYINPVVIERLKKYEVSTVELGVQSLDIDVLNKSERGHSPLDVKKAVTLLKEARFNVGIQLMPGLPGDTYEKIMDTTRKVLLLEPNMVRIYPTVVVKDTKLATMYQNKEYQPFSLEKITEITSEMLMLFWHKKIKVIRIGLQSTDNLQKDKDLIGGPYHPAMGELAKARVFRKQLEYIITNNKVSLKLNVNCNPKDISQVKGQHNTNISYLEEKYKIKINITCNDKLERGSLTWGDENNTKLLTRGDFLKFYCEK